MAGRYIAVVVTACVGAAVVGGCGGGARHATAPHAAAAAGRAQASEPTDLRSPDVDARMDPARSGTVYACPDARRVEVVFDPRGTVSVVSERRPLVYGTFGTRAVHRACRPHGVMRGVPKGTLSERTDATKLACALPRSARFEVHAISVGGREVGSMVVVLEASLKRIVLSAVLEPDGSRLYYGRACRAR